MTDLLWVIDIARSSYYVGIDAAGTRAADVEPAEKTRAIDTYGQPRITAEIKEMVDR